MAATKENSKKALAALTTAALGLPGLDAHGASAITNAQGNVMYGHYQESQNRMQVDVYHGDFIVPITEKLEFAFSVDRDTYSGATPAYSMPVEMANQPKYKQGSSTIEHADIVSAASGTVSGGGLTVLGGLNNFKAFFDARAGAKQQFKANNPYPESPPTGPTIPSDVLLQFNDFLAAAYYGKSNLTPNSDGSCPAVPPFGPLDCYSSQGMIVGTLGDPNNPVSTVTAHLHRSMDPTVSPATPPAVQYHADSPGIYVRALDGSAFSLKSMVFYAPIEAANPGTGPNDFWNIIGFNTAVNPNLTTNPNASSQIAYQKVANGFQGTLDFTSNPNFQNINAFWINYNGYPSVPPVGVSFNTIVDNISLGGVKATGKTQEQLAWEAALNQFAYIAQYSAVINKPISNNTKIVQHFQEMPLETRTQPTFMAKYYLNDTVINLSGGYSDEPDFLSNFGSVNFIHEFNDKHTTATLGYNLTSNYITRSTDTSHASHSGTHEGHLMNPITYPNLQENSTFQGFNLSIAQVIDKLTLLQISGTFNNQHGYLSNPYKYVYVRGVLTPEDYYNIWQTPDGQLNINNYTNLQVAGPELFREVRPRLRNQGTVSFGVSRHIPELDASLNADYRFFSDNWGINSHTLEFKWYQPLGHGIMVTPNIRYYSQSQADFFAPYFLAPRADGYYSSDYRLSAYGTLGGGVTFTKSFSKGISLQAGFEYFTHAGNLKLGGGGENAYADYSYYVVTGGLNFNLSAPAFNSEEDHHHHHHHGGEAPAGVMYAHLMEQEGDLMVGYRYFYSNQGGHIFHGDQPVPSRTVINYGCEYFYCLSKPTNMSMHMHMFEIMYAPTDWLNLMIMPMLMDMDMSTTPLVLGAEDTHTGGHSTHDLGDTIMMGLFKIYSDHTHKVIGGLGVSAPTGPVNLTVSGQQSGDLQDYGMQLGSGTWDFRPVLTYTGSYNQIAWGVQANGIKRLEGRNSSGYTLGDFFQTSAWGSYNPVNWFQASIRGIFTWQGAIRGTFNRSHSVSSPVDFPSNYGGRFWDVGFGLNFSVPDGEFMGHKASVEWLQPVSDDFNGYQLERTGTLAATWTYSF